MMYPYMTLDETEIVHSHLMKDENEQPKIIVHFEKPTDEGFDSARCELPSYEWIYNQGFSDEEIETFTRFLQSNAHLLFKYAANGGVHIA